MKPESIEARKARRKREAVGGVILYALLELVTGVCFGVFACVPDLPGWAAVLLWVLAALCLGSILPAILVLRTRFKEIEGGELDAAAEY